MAVKTKLRLIKTGFTLAETPLRRHLAGHEPSGAQNSIPLTWAKARDCSVWDEGGNKFIDLTSGIFVANAGHANPHIKKAIKKCLDQDLLFAYSYPTKIRERFEKKLLSLSPKHLNAVALSNTGTEAMMLAYRLIKVYGNERKKKYIVTFRGNYHGRGLSNDFISGSPEKASWSGVKDDSIVFLDFPYDPKMRFDPKKLPKAGAIAGFVLETYQGWGAWFYPRAFIRDLAAFAKKNGALLCIDDLQGGFYRMGPLYGYQTYGNLKPDILSLGKGISSSLPLAAVLARKTLFAMDRKADLFGTQSGNPVCVAAGLANIEFLSSAKQKAHRKKILPVFKKEMYALLQSPLIKQVNLRGLVAGIIFHTTKDATAVAKECIRRGVLPVCTNRESIKIAPPLTITSQAIKEAAGVLREALDVCAKKNSL